MKQSVNITIVLVLLVALIYGAATFATPGSYALALTGMLFLGVITYRHKSVQRRVSRIQHNDQASQRRAHRHD